VATGASPSGGAPRLPSSPVVAIGTGLLAGASVTATLTDEPSPLQLTALIFVVLATTALTWHANALLKKRYVRRKLCVRCADHLLKPWCERTSQTVCATSRAIRLGRGTDAVQTTVTTGRNGPRHLSRSQSIASRGELQRVQPPGCRTWVSNVVDGAQEVLSGMPRTRQAGGLPGSRPATTT
jgi:hypothetical protein